MPPVDEAGIADDLHCAFFHEALQDWLTDPAITIACGDWRDGAISEIMPAGRARLLPGIYTGEFSGIRELRLTDSPHHLHIDLRRVHRMCYTVVPSVCFGFNPSLEVKLLIRDRDGVPTDRSVLSLMFTRPYQNDGTLDPAAVFRFFTSAHRLLRQRPDLVSVAISSDIRGGVYGPVLFEGLAAANQRDYGGADWAQALADLGASPPSPLSPPVTKPALSSVVSLLKEALCLRDASLVIFRDRTLVEFKTELLGGVHRYEEKGHVSWQIGDFHGHHCHMALGEIAAVEFSAEPVPCQGNRLNYTIWFLTSGACGNPYRRDGYFSITLNRPYEAGAPRLEVIGPVFALYSRYSRESWVRADAEFLLAMQQGPTGKVFGEAEHASS